MSKSHFCRYALLSVAILTCVIPVAAQEPQEKRGDGIKVHGHWTIDVHNPDGRLVSHNEFENALEHDGASALYNVLGRVMTPAGWRLLLLNGATNGPCVRNSASGGTNPTVSVTPPASLDPQAPVVGAVGFSSLAVLGLAAADPQREIFTVTVGAGAPPGFLLTQLDFPAGGDIDGGTAFFSWDPNTPPGVYPIVITVADASHNSNVYTITITVPSQAGGTVPFPCTAVEPGTFISSDLTEAWYPTLTLNVVQSAFGAVGLEISGNITVFSADAIDEVRSFLVFNNGVISAFSSRVLQTPIQVVTGQKIYVKVAFSFT